jgi:hypothetical protein
LSWQSDGHENFRARDGKSIPFTRTTKGDMRRVRRVRLTSAGSTYTAELSGDDAKIVALRVEGERAKDTWLVPLQNIDNTSLIERAILESGRDQVFETSLMTVREILG